MWVVLSEQQQAAQGRIQLPVGRDLPLRSLRIQHAGAGVGNIAKDGAFFLGKALHCLHQVGNQVGAPLQLHVHLRPHTFYRLILRYHLVPGADKAAKDHQHNQDQNAYDSECNSNSTTHNSSLLLWPPLKEAHFSKT